MQSNAIDELNLIGSFYSDPVINQIKNDNDNDYKYIYAFVASLLLEYIINEEKLVLTTVQRAVEYKKANDLINKTFSTQIKSESKKVTDILKDTISKLIKFRNKKSGNVWDVSNKDVKDILDKEIDGKNYSDRIYDNKNKVAKLLKKLIKDLVDGKTSVNTIKDIIKSTSNSNTSNTDRLVDNEISRVCRALDEKYFEENNILDLVYCGILDKHICEKCFAHDGKPYKTNDPKRPKLPLHIKCRCFYAIANETGNAQNMSANNSNNKNPVSGEKISYEQLNKFANELNTLGINSYGFEEYSGDPNVLTEIIKDLKIIFNEFHMIRNLKNGLTLKYEDLGNAEDLAITKGKTIILNKRIYDDSEYIKQFYDELSNEGWFVRGTNYRSVIYHETGHILNNKDKKLLKSVENEVRKKSAENNVNFKTYLQKNISEYSALTFDGYNYHEILPELISMCYNCSNNKLALEILEYLNLR